MRQAHHTGCRRLLTACAVQSAGMPWQRCQRRLEFACAPFAVGCSAHTRCRTLCRCSQSTLLCLRVHQGLLSAAAAARAVEVRQHVHSRPAPRGQRRSRSASSAQCPLQVPFRAGASTVLQCPLQLPSRASASTADNVSALALSIGGTAITTAAAGNCCWSAFQQPLPERLPRLDAEGLRSMQQQQQQQHLSTPMTMNRSAAAAGRISIGPAHRMWISLQQQQRPPALFTSQCSKLLQEKAATIPMQMMRMRSRQIQTRHCQLSRQ